MNVLLPKTPFVYNNGAAVVEGNFLYIYRPVDFNDLMYALTYEIYRDDMRCFYCGEPLTEKQRTLDHRLPVDLGGPSLTNNLVPTCRKCNSTKGNLTEEQFKKFMRFSKPEEAKLYRLGIERGHKEIRQGKKIIPPEWLCPPDYPLNVIKMRMHVDVPLGRGYNSIKRKHNKYGAILRPVIISANKELLDGFNVCLFAKGHNCWEKVSIIKLDNVVTMY